jgi:hypothetical protein
MQLSLLPFQSSIIFARKDMCVLSQQRSRFVLQDLDALRALPVQCCWLLITARIKAIQREYLVLKAPILQLKLAQKGFIAPSQSCSSNVLQAATVCEVVLNPSHAQLFSVHI